MIAQRAGFHTQVVTAWIMGTILDDRDPMPPGDLADFIHLAALPKQVDRDNRLGFGRDQRFQFVWVEIQGPRVNIAKHDFRPQGRERHRGGNPGQRSGDHFVTRSYAGSDARQGQPGGG